MLISPRKGKYRYYTTVQAVRCFPKLASPKQLTVGTCAAFFFAISVGRLLNRRAGTRFWRRSEASKKAKLQAALRSATDRLTAERIPSSCQFSRETSRRVRRKANLFSQPWRARQGSLQISPDQTAQTAAQTAAGLWRISSSFQQRRQGSRHGGHLQFLDFLGLEGPGKHRNARIWFAIMWWSLQSNLGWKLEVFNLLVEGNVFHKWESESMMSISLRENEEKTNWLAWRKMLVSRSADFDMAKWWKMSPWNLIIWSVFCPRSRWSRWSRYQELIHQHDDSIFTIHCHIFPLPGGTQKHRNSISALQLEVSIWDAEVLRPRGCSLERNLPWRTLNLGGFERFSESK